MTKFSNKLKKPGFWPILHPFSTFWGAKKLFLENPAVMHNFIGILVPCENLEKTDDTIPRKHPERRTERRTERRKDGQTLFPVTARGS